MYSITNYLPPVSPATRFVTNSGKWPTQMLKLPFPNSVPSASKVCAATLHVLEQTFNFTSSKRLLIGALFPEKELPVQLDYKLQLKLLASAPQNQSPG